MYSVDETREGRVRVFNATFNNILVISTTIQSRTRTLQENVKEKRSLCIDHPMKGTWSQSLNWIDENNGFTTYMKMWADKMHLCLKSLINNIVNSGICKIRYVYKNNLDLWVLNVTFNNISATCLMSHSVFVYFLYFGRGN